MVDYDVITIGGGPGGAAASTLLAQRGYKVLLLERSRTPRFKIGESLMPATYWTLQRMGVLPRMKHADFLQHLASADVVLDTFYFGGCNSSCDAFALSAPVATLPGFLLPGRSTLGLYEELGVTDCIARTPAEFVDIALRLGKERDFRESVVRQISRNADRLFDRPDCGVALGEALLKIAEESR